MQTAEPPVSTSSACLFDSWLDKAGLAIAGFLDAFLNGSLDSASVVFNPQIQNDLKEARVQAQSGSDLGRLRALRDRLEKSGEQDQIEVDTAATAVRRMGLKDRLDPLLRRQSRCVWRPRTKK